MTDSETGVAQKTEVEQFIENFGAEVPDFDLSRSSTETVTLELSEANAHRLANGMALAASTILEEEPERGIGATRQVLGLRNEVKRQLRDQEYGGRDD